MKQIICLDTETTGIEGGRLIELAYAVGDDEPALIRAKNPVPIEIEAKATHHLTEDILSHYPFFTEHNRYDIAKDVIENNIVVAHNALFDIGVLAREDINVRNGNFIDTQRVAKHLYPDATKYNLQYLRYYLDLKVSEDSLAHSAIGDVKVLQALYQNLTVRCREEYPDQDPVGIMLELTRRPALVLTLNFGKHYGKSFEEVAKTDPGYLRWLKENPRDDEDTVFTADYWLLKIKN